VRIKLCVAVLAVLALTLACTSYASSERMLYQAIEGKVLKPGQAVVATIEVPKTQRSDPNVIGVTVPGSEWPDRFVAAYYHSDGAFIAVWIGKRGSSWSENYEVWKESADPGSTHKVVITFKGGTITFKVDGKVVYTFSTSAKELRVIYYNTDYSVGNALLASSKWLIVGIAGVGILAVVIALLLPVPKARRVR